MFSFIFSVIQALLGVKSALSKVFSSLFKKKSSDRSQKQYKIINNQNTNRRIIDVEKQEVEVAAQPSPDVKDVDNINKWLLDSHNKD